MAFFVSVATGVVAAGSSVAAAAAMMGVAGFTVGWGTLLTVGSIAYQATQAKKMRESARSAAETRKGFEMVAQGAVGALPVVYGRALIGGVRVWHQTMSDFRFNGSTATVVFSVGPDGNKLDKDHSGTKNEFLMFQQAICQGDCNVIDVLINGGTNLDELTYAKGDSGALKSALRIDVHDAATGSSCLVASHNSSVRQNSNFTKASYATVTVKLDRDEPQFQGVPDIQFIVEGKTVGYFNGSSYSRTYDANMKAWLGATQYSTNPALCLLDYLIDNTSGKALLPDQIDFPSFKQAADVCNTTVLSNALVGGQIWKPVGQSNRSRDVSRRNIPLYECNMIVDTTRPIRENIEAMLSTMGDARLVWSQGKYKLLVQYPQTNAHVDIAATLTDDDLMMDDSIEIKWPSSAERLNYATVRFHNESIDFKEDSVSWPAKKGGVTSRMLGNEVYPIVTGWDDNEGGKFLNSYGVWQGTGSSTTLTWKFEAKLAGTYTFRFTADDTVNVSVSPGGSWSRSEWRSTSTVTFYSNANTLHTLMASVTDTGGKKGFAGLITGPDGAQVWSSRSPAYTDRILIDTTSQANVYNAMLNEDNGVNLEADVFAEGVTDYYHALAKAEELVRTSRSAFVISFKYLIKDKYFEPGDIIRLMSPTLKFEDGIYVRVTEATLEDAMTCRIVGSRFDYTQLAWNVSDDQYLKPRNPYEDNLAAPSSLSYRAGSYRYKSSSGTLDWTPVDDSRVVGYILYAAHMGTGSSSVESNFFEIGRSSEVTFELPDLAFEVARFGVRAYTSSGRRSAMTTSSIDTLISGRVPPTPSISSIASSTTKSEISLSLSWPASRGDISITIPIPVPGHPTQYVPVTIPDKYDDHAVAQIWRSSTDSFPSATLVGETASFTPATLVNGVYTTPNLSVYVDTNEVFGDQYYWVQLVSNKGMKSSPSVSASGEFNHFEGKPTDLTPPPAPYNLTSQNTFSMIVLSWTNPTHNVGGGHSHSRVYVEEAVEGQAPDYNNAKTIGTPADPSFWFTGVSGKSYNFWVKEVSKGGGLSFGAATLFNVAATNTAEVQNAIDILNGGITNSNLLNGLEAVAYWTGAVLPTEKHMDANLISWNAVLYKWDGSAYVKAVAAADLTGVLTGEQLQDGIISTAKFASGLKPVEILSTLPTTGNTDGRVVMLTTDGKLYRYNNNAWSASVPAADVTGVLTASQLQDGIINTAKFAAGLEPITLVTTLPTTKVTTFVSLSGTLYKWNGTSYGQAVTASELAGAINATQIADGAVTTPKMVANSISGDRIAANSLSADKIVANSITSGQIQAGAIKTDQLDAGAVVASKIATDAVIASKIQSGAVTTDKMTANTINGDRIAAGTLSADKITANSITSSQIQAGAITADRIASYNLTTANASIANAVIKSAMIESVGADKITAGTVTSLTINGSNINVTGAGSSYNYARSGNKWWRDGLNGWIFAMNGDGGTFAEMKGGTNGIWMSSWDDCGISFPKFYVDSTGNAQFGGVLTAQAVNAVNTINIAGQSVTVTESASHTITGNGNNVTTSGSNSYTFETYMAHGGELMVIAVCTAFSGSPATDVVEINLSIDGWHMQGFVGTDTLALGSHTLIGKKSVSSGWKNIQATTSWQNLEPMQNVVAAWRFIIHKAYR